MEPVHYIYWCPVFKFISVTILPSLDLGWSTAQVCGTLIIPNTSIPSNAYKGGPHVLWPTKTPPEPALSPCMLQDLKWPPLDLRMREHRLCMMFKIVIGEVAIRAADHLNKADKRTRSNHPRKFRHLTTHWTSTNNTWVEPTTRGSRLSGHYHIFPGCPISTAYYPPPLQPPLPPSNPPSPPPTPPPPLQPPPPPTHTHTHTHCRYTRYRGEDKCWSRSSSRLDLIRQQVS